MKEDRKKILVACRPPKSEPLIRRTDSPAESLSGEAERGVERKTQRRRRSGGSETRDNGSDALLKAEREEQEEKERYTSIEGTAVTGG